MTKPKRDLVREKRIQQEVIVDAHGPEEQAIGSFYYLEDKIRFSFQAKCIASRVISSLCRGEFVGVQGVVPEDKCAGHILVLTRWAGPHHCNPLSQLTPSTLNENK